MLRPQGALSTRFALRHGNSQLGFVPHDRRELLKRVSFPPNMEPYDIMMGMILVLTPIICWYFTRSQKEFRIPWREWAHEFHEKRYYLHAMGYIVIIRWKSITDRLNEPMKIRTGHWTDYIYGIEGEFTKWIQDSFKNELLTDILNFHYLFIYLFFHSLMSIRRRIESHCSHEGVFSKSSA